MYMNLEYTQADDPEFYVREVYMIHSKDIVVYHELQHKWHMRLMRLQHLVHHRS